MNTQERVFRVVAEHMGAEYKKLTPNTRLVEDLNADSLDKVELVMALEEEFDIEISDQEADDVTDNDATLITLAEFIERKRKEPA